jgi:Protein of unknown function (DUF3093)
MGYPGVRAWLPYLLTVPLTSVFLGLLGRHRVALCNGELRVGPAQIPVHALGEVQLIEPSAKRRALGPDLDPAAFVLHTGWVGPVLRITITDPADPTPYWIFSVRQAEKLASLLRGSAGEVSNESSEPHSPGH